jgi:hypothetical protein
MSATAWEVSAFAVNGVWPTGRSQSTATVDRSGTTLPANLVREARDDAADHGCQFLQARRAGQVQRSPDGLRAP